MLRVFSTLHVCLNLAFIKLVLLLGLNQFKVAISEYPNTDEEENN